VFNYFAIILYSGILYGSNNISEYERKTEDFSITCDFCTKKIMGKYIIIENNNYHDRCYKEHIQLHCDQCNKRINGSYNIKNNNNYHPRCFKYFVLDRCDICDVPIENEYIKDMWGNIYHGYHENELPKCESCSRIVCNRMTGGGFIINETRNICNLCWDNVISNKSNIKNITKKVISILNKVGINNLPDKIPIVLVDSREDLNRISNIRLGKIQGYTKYEYETLGGVKVSEKYKIYILNYLHEINFHAVLAHELLHVYLFQNNLNISESNREGFCNLGSQLVYETYDNQLSNIKLKGMYQDTDPDYGKGFIRMNSNLEKYGWKKLLKILAQL